MNDLLDECAVLETTGDPRGVDVHGVQHDSRRVRAGDLFFCLRGARYDGHAFAPDAVRRGAVGLVCERLVPPDRLGARRDVVQARVASGSVRSAMARLSAAFYGFPSRELLMAGVTGTNGKTTVTHLLAHILKRSGRATEVIGTLSGARTTPEATELEALLATVRDRHRVGDPAPAVSMEVSSHALVLHRVDAIRFDVAVFTNLSRDHLDFHATMEEYFRAKASLFTPERARLGVVMVDDPWGARLAREAQIPVVRVARNATSAVFTRPGLTGFRWRGLDVTVPLSGTLNADNALLAAEAAVALGSDPVLVAQALADARPVPGRLEVVTGPDERGGPPFVVIVDYAHTPAALEVALTSARGLAGSHGKVLVAFGCGGGRDPGKRPLMGEVAARLADVAVVTTDNPRDEDPASIAHQVREGIPGDHRAEVATVLDRARAMTALMRRARPGDVVVLAGKGHETYQEIGGRHLPFDDRRAARAALGLEPSPTRSGST